MSDRLSGALRNTVIRYAIILKQAYDNLIVPSIEKIFGGLYVGTVVKGLYLQSAMHACLGSGAHKVFDAGCGSFGTYAVLFARRYPGIDFVAVDLNVDEKFARQPNELTPNLSLLQGDLLDIKWKDYFDIVYTIDVLEHIRDYSLCLGNLRESLRQGGKIIIHVPHKEQKRYFLKSERYVSAAYAQPKEGDDHVREGFNKSDLERELSQMGLRVKKSRYTFGLPLSFTKELFNWAEKKRLPGIGIALLPLSVILWGLEAIFGCKRGNGIFILAIKN